MSWGVKQAARNEAHDGFKLCAEEFQEEDSKHIVDVDWKYEPSHPSVTDTIYRQSSHVVTHKARAGKPHTRKQSLYCRKTSQFTCPYCPYQTKQRWNVLKHIKLKHQKTSSVVPNFKFWSCVLLVEATVKFCCLSFLVHNSTFLDDFYFQFCVCVQWLLNSKGHSQDVKMLQT
jgi:hypothetical protein